MTPDPDRLFALLPAWIRLRDEQQGGPLRALLSVVTEQAAALQDSIEQAYDDQFIETCAPWVVPYIGDLVGTGPVFDARRTASSDTAEALFTDLAGPSLGAGVALHSRADVARTILYRRRKATRPMLEQLARDVTGWGAHVVEMFTRLGWTQCVRNHLRPDCTYAPDLRRAEPLGRIGGPFDGASHLVDVRPVSQLDGWYDLLDVVFFLWRLEAIEETGVAARAVGGAGDYRYHVSPLGNPAPLFSHLRTDGSASGVARELDVPGPIRPAAFYDDLQAYLASPAPRPGFSAFYGNFAGVPGAPFAPGASLFIVRDGAPVPVEAIRCADLTTWQQPTQPVVAVDVRLGRLAFGAGFVPTSSVTVHSHRGFSAELGGGGYPRPAWLLQSRLAGLRIVVDQSGATPGSVTTLTDALLAWTTAGKPDTLISIVDSGSHALPALSIELADNRWLVIEAANRCRPHLRLAGALEVTGDHPGSALTLSGLLVEGWVHVRGVLGKLRLLHTTLVPGRALTADGGPATQLPSLVADPVAPTAPPLRVEIAFAVSGPIRLPPDAEGIWILDSIVDGLGGGALGEAGALAPAAWIERSTLLGTSDVRQLTYATEVLFSGRVTAERRQVGCARFSFVPDGSKTPRRFRCQPDLEIADEAAAAEQARGAKLTAVERAAIHDAVVPWLVPSFSSTRYGQPAYAQLHLACPTQIARGAEDGSEMGAFCHLKQPQREANLRLRLREYLPFGLEPGLVYVT